MTFSMMRSVTACAAAALLAGPVFASGEAWTTDFEAALATAEEEGKDVLLDFTGSDWCPPCIALTSEVFSHDSFLDTVPAEFVLVELDYPNGPQDEDLAAQNSELAERYAIRSFPTIMLADALGRPYAVVSGYRPGSGPEGFLAEIDELKQVRGERDSHMAAADEAEGAERAQHLHAALQIVGDEIAVNHYGPVVEEIIAIDAENEAGLKEHYEALLHTKRQQDELNSLRSQLSALMGEEEGTDPEATIAAVDAFLTDDTLENDARQEALAIKSQVYLFVLEDQPNAKEALLAAIAVDPDSQMGQGLQNALERFFGGDE